MSVPKKSWKEGRFSKIHSYCPADLDVATARKNLLMVIEIQLEETAVAEHQSYRLCSVCRNGCRTRP